MATEIQNTLTQLLTNYTNQFDWTTAALNTFTTNLAAAKNKTHAKYYTRELEAAQQRINMLTADLSAAYDRKTKAERELIMNKQNADEDIRPFLDTIKNTKAIEVIATTDESMVLKITAPLQYFMSTDFEAYEKNPNSDYNRYYANRPILKTILHKIFVTREYQLITQGIIKLKINNSVYNSNILQYNAQAALNEYSEFPNPHLYHHDCWSQAKQEIEKNICEGNYELVIMQMVAAVQSINIAEHISFVNGLLSDICNDSYNTKVTIIDKDKNKYTWAQIQEHEVKLQDEKIKAAAAEALKTAQNSKEGYTQVVVSEEDNIDVEDED